MKSLRKLALSILSLTIIFSSLLYIGCEGDDDNVGDYFDNNPYGGNPSRESFADAPTSNTTPTLAISPASANVAISGTQIFTASGGTPPYNWFTENSHGTVVKQSDDKVAIYTQTSASINANKVTVIDNAGRSATAQIN